LAIPVEIPVDLSEQRAIAHILGTLDDKIELNRRMSETLEAMARALFKSWFVDFDPVRAKMEGRWQRGQSLPGLPAHLYDLFPNRLEDSELGEIPDGWEVGTLGQVLGELVSGARPKGGAAQEGVPSVGAENVIGLGRYEFSKEKYVPRAFFNELQRKGAAVRPGDVLLYKDGAQIGRKTYFDYGFPHEQCAVNEHVFIVRAKHAHYQRYLFFWLDQDWMTQEIISLNSNSAQPGINQQGVRALPLLKPPYAMVEAFDRLSKKLTDRLFAACHESRTLAALRDALLPKLISGELRVKDAERFLKERGL
jgi:type I restriction enzyme S subunit